MKFRKYRPHAFIARNMTGMAMHASSDMLPMPVSASKPKRYDKA